MKYLKDAYIRHIHEMCLKYPTYHTASPGERDRANYIEKTFQEYGLKTRRESYGVRGWDFRSFSLRDVTAGREVPNAVCQYFSGSVDFVGKLQVVTLKQIDEIEKMDVAGKVIFVTGTKGIFGNAGFAEKMEEMGAVGVIHAQVRADIGHPHTKFSRSPYISTIATCAVGPLGSAYLSANLDHVYHLAVNASPYDTVTDNVIGYVEGDDTKLVFGAHYDSAPLTQGAGDDVSGTAMLLEMAKMLKDKSCGHTMEFVAFSGEEYCERPPAHGAKGSNAYMEIHNGEKIAAYINFDDYCVSPLFAEEILAVDHPEKLPRINWYTEIQAARLAGDDVAFYDRGYPVIWISQKKQIRVLHSQQDNIEFVDFDSMVQVTGKYLDIATQLLESV